MPEPTYDKNNPFTIAFDELASHAEAGINIESFEDPMEYIEDKAGANTGFIHAFNPRNNNTISGEVNVADPANTLGIAFGTAEVVANSVDGYGASSGDWYLDDIEIASSRGSLLSASANLTRRPEFSGDKKTLTVSPWLWRILRPIELAGNAAERLLNWIIGRV